MRKLPRRQHVQLAAGSVRREDQHPMARTMTLVCLLALASVLPGILPAQSTKPAEAVKVVATRIDTRPTLITGKIRNQSASDLFFKLAQPAGGGVAARDENLWDDPAFAAASFSADWERQPFWEAMNEACESMGLRAVVDLNHDASGQLVLERSRSQMPASLDGAAVVRIEQLLRDATFNYADQSRAAEKIVVTLQLLLEPRLRGLAWIHRPVIDKADDDAGHSLLAAAEKVRDESGVIYGDSVATTLTYPATAGAKIALLRGSIRVQHATELASLRLAQPFGPGKATTVRVGENKLVFRKVARNPDGTWGVSLTLDRGKKETLAHWRIMVRRFVAWQTSLSLIGQRGAFRSTGGSSGWDDQHGELQQSYAPVQADDVPSEVRIELPRKFEAMDVKFEFKDLPMP